MNNKTAVLKTAAIVLSIPPLTYGAMKFESMNWGLENPGPTEVVLSSLALAIGLILLVYGVQGWWLSNKKKN